MSGQYLNSHPIQFVLDDRGDLETIRRVTMQAKCVDERNEIPHLGPYFEFFRKDGVGLTPGDELAGFIVAAIDKSFPEKRLRGTLGDDCVGRAWKTHEGCFIDP